MPRGDRTGPAGFGPMTGRGLGYCAGYSTPGFAKNIGYFGRGMGLGFRRGFGRGYGFRFRYQTQVPAILPPIAYLAEPQMMPSIPYGSSVPYIAPQIISKEEQVKILKDQKDYLEKQISELAKEIEKLESE